MQSYGIVLHSIRYSDTQMIVDIFTESAGVVPFILRTGRMGRGGLKASLWQPLALVDVTWDHRTKANLQKTRELALWHPWRTLTAEPHKAAIGLYLSEFLHHALRHEQENKPLFNYLINALTWFDESEEHYANFHIVFLLRLTRFLGFLPNVEDWVEGSYFDLQTAMFTRTRPLHVHYLNPEEAILVPKFLRMDLRTMRAVGLNRFIRRRALEIVTDFYRLHIPEFPESRSLDILAEVFS